MTNETFVYGKVHINTACLWRSSMTFMTSIVLIARFNLVLVDEECQ